MGLFIRFSYKGFEFHYPFLHLNWELSWKTLVCSLSSFVLSKIIGNIQKLFKLNKIMNDDELKSNDSEMADEAVDDIINSKKQYLESQQFKLEVIKACAIRSSSDENVTLENIQNYHVFEDLTNVLLLYNQGNSINVFGSKNELIGFRKLKKIIEPYCIFVAFRNRDQPEDVKYRMFNSFDKISISL